MTKADLASLQYEVLKAFKSDNMIEVRHAQNKLIKKVFLLDVLPLERPPRTKEKTVMVSTETGFYIILMI